MKFHDGTKFTADDLYVVTFALVALLIALGAVFTMARLGMWIGCGA